MVTHKPYTKEIDFRRENKNDQSKKIYVEYQIICDDCKWFYEGKTEKNLQTGKEAAIRKPEPLSMISVYKAPVKIITQGNTRHW